jgi:uncharacterized protein YfbU (UPF0304 family)
MLDRYRRMLAEWNRSADQNNLTKEELMRITSV